MIRSLVVVTLLACGSSAHAQPDATRKVGRVIVVGNTETPDDTILGVVRFRPGDTYRPADLKDAINRLTATRWFVTGRRPERGPTVESFPNELNTTYSDIIIRIEEQPWNGVVWGVRRLRIGFRANNLVYVWQGAVQLADGLPQLQTWRDAQRR